VAPRAEVESASHVSREDRLIERDGLITIAGGKLTTYRRMAARVVDAALPQLGRRREELPCRTADAPLPGAEGLNGKAVPGVALALAALEVPGLDPQVARHLARTYGSRALALGQRIAKEGGVERLDPELPYVMAEVDLAVTEEGALRLEDVLSRRLPLLLRARDQGLSCAGRVAARMARHLHWTEARIQAEVGHYQNVVALSRRFRAASASA
jgi:glycerol-3-phosphate dehydrogenase